MRNSLVRLPDFSFSSMSLASIFCLMPAGYPGGDAQPECRSTRVNSRCGLFIGIEMLSGHPHLARRKLAAERAALKPARGWMKSAQANWWGERMQNSFKGKRALLTGNSSGIGFHVALMLAQAGVRELVLNGRNAERGEGARRAIAKHCPGAKVEFVAADVSTPAGAQSMLQGGAKHLGGGIDILVNCAGGEHNPRLFRDYS